MKKPSWHSSLNLLAKIKGPITEQMSDLAYIIDPLSAAEPRQPECRHLADEAAHVRHFDWIVTQIPKLGPFDVGSGFGHSQFTLSTSGSGCMGHIGVQPIE